jgi:hypothetical protein
MNPDKEMPTMTGPSLFRPAAREGLTTRRRLFAWALPALLALATAPAALAQSHQGGKGGGGGGDEGTGGSHGGGGDEGGEEGGGGGKGKAAGRTPGERAQRHRARTGQTLGGGEGKGPGHTGGHHGDGGDEEGGGTDDTTDTADTLSGGSVAGGSTGAEHFVHDSPGYWGVDGKVLRR